MNRTKWEMSLSIDRKRKKQENLMTSIPFLRF